MIVTHPLLFNLIVILFIAFTSAWLAFVINGRAALKLKDKIAELENEKELLSSKIFQLQEELEKRSGFTVNNTPVISLSSPSVKANKAN